MEGEWRGGLGEVGVLPARWSRNHRRRFGAEAWQIMTWRASSGDGECHFISTHHETARPSCSPRSCAMRAAVEGSPDARARPVNANLREVQARVAGGRVSWQRKRAPRPAPQPARPNIRVAPWPTPLPSSRYTCTPPYACKTRPSRRPFWLDITCIRCF